MNNISPAPDIYGLEVFLERFDKLVAARVVDVGVTFIPDGTECEDLRRADIALQMPEHLLAARTGCIYAHDLLAFFAVEGVKIHPAAVRPGLHLKFFVETINILLMSKSYS